MARWSLVTLHGYLIFKFIGRSGSELKQNENLQKTNIFLKNIENRNPRFFVSNYIDFWHRKIHMVETYSSKIEKSISLKK